MAETQYICHLSVTESYHDMTNRAHTWPYRFQARWIYTLLSLIHTPSGQLKLSVLFEEVSTLEESSFTQQQVNF